jgi:hypothetical protein
MRDGDIRRELDALLRKRYAGDLNTLIRHEMGLCAGQRRIDVALLNGEISGYEIKSDEDTLFRLLGQADVYGRVLDRVTLVTTSRHQEKSMGLLPLWWGIIVARQERGRVTLETVREPDINNELDSFALAQLLWRDEALEELKTRGLSKGFSKKARHYVWLELAQAVSIEELRVLVRARPRNTLSTSGDRSITSRIVRSGRRPVARADNPLTEGVERLVAGEHSLFTVDLPFALVRVPQIRERAVGYVSWNTMVPNTVVAKIGGNRRIPGNYEAEEISIMPVDSCRSARQNVGDRLREGPGCDGYAPPRPVLISPLQHLGRYRCSTVNVSRGLHHPKVYE